MRLPAPEPATMDLDVEQRDGDRDGREQWDNDKVCFLTYCRFAEWAHIIPFEQGETYMACACYLDNTDLV